MNIVVIDDDRALLRSLRILFEDRGHHVACFFDLAEARRYLEGDERIDVMFVDYVMPLGTGEQLLQEIHGRLKESCKTIMITGHSEQIKSHKILQALGVCAIMSKPLDLDQMCSLVE